MSSNSSIIICLHSTCMKLKQISLSKQSSLGTNKSKLSLTSTDNICASLFMVQATLKNRTMTRTTIEKKHSNIKNDGRSEEHTSELQSRFELVCSLLLEKKITEIQTFRLLILDRKSTR